MFGTVKEGLIGRHLTFAPTSTTRRSSANGGLLKVLRDVALLEAEIAKLWGRIQAESYVNQRAVVEDLHTRRALRRGLTVERAADILWTLNDPEFYRLLASERGWPPDARDTKRREA